MSLPLVGELALWIALLLTVWGIILTIAGSALDRRDLARSGARAVHATALMLALSCLALAASLQRHDFTMAAVAAHGSRAATTAELAVAVWAGLPGALLVMAFAAALVLTVLDATGPRSSDNRQASVALETTAGQLVIAGMLVTLLASTSPFERLPWPTADGPGLAPSQRHLAMLIIWPAWSLGIGCAIGMFTLAMPAALGRSGSTRSWLAAQRWALPAWLLVGIALLAALWWSYETPPGDGGWLVRGVDAVSLTGWLALTLASHAPVVGRPIAPRGLLVLVCAPLLLLLLAPLTAPDGTWNPLHGLVHRGAGVAWIVLLAAAAQVLAYAIVRVRRDAGGIVLPRPPSSIGARLSHVGFALVIAALAAQGARRDHLLMLVPAARDTISDVLGRPWEVTFQGLSVREQRSAVGEPRWRELLVPLSLARDGEGALVVPEVREHVDVFGRPTASPFPRPAIWRGPLQDIVATPDSVGEGDAARVRVAFVPLSGLVWLGGLATLAGGLMTGLARWRHSR